MSNLNNTTNNRSCNIIIRNIHKHKHNHTPTPTTTTTTTATTTTTNNNHNNNINNNIVLLRSGGYSAERRAATDADP